MLRALVLLMLLVNAGLYFWLRSDPQMLQSDREPQRLSRQVSPDAVEVLPDLPAASGAKGAMAAAIQVAVTASAVDAGSAASASFAHRTSESDVDCAETPPLDDAQFTALKAALTKGGVPPDAIAERRQSQGGVWLVYLGKFADAQTTQQRVDEMTRLNLKFERVTNPASLTPGLSFGRFTSQPDAARKLDEITKRGVHGARVATMTSPTIQRHLQVRATDPAWHHAAGAQRFETCPLDTAGI